MRKISNIIINGQKHEISSPSLSYEDIVHIVYGHGNVMPSMTFAYLKQDGHPGGILMRGKSIEIEDGLCVSAVVTNAA